jgi:molybdopterin converting factor small subunit
LGIKIHIHPTLRRVAKGTEVVEVKGSKVGECLHDLIRQFPDIRQSLFDSKGALLPAIEIYLNMESTYPDELLKPTKDGDEIYITMQLVGG